MKKIISILLIMCSVFAFSSCKKDQEHKDTSVIYYYRTAEVDFGSEQGVVAGEIRNITRQDNDYQTVVEQYLNGPVSREYVSPFPAGITLEELNIDDNKVQIVLSPHLALLSGAELMTACACLANTLLELTGVRTIQISSENGLLNNTEVITLTTDSFAYWDESVQFIQ